MFYNWSGTKEGEKIVTVQIILFVLFVIFWIVAAILFSNEEGKTVAEIIVGWYPEGTLTVEYFESAEYKRAVWKVGGILIAIWTVICIVIAWFRTKDEDDVDVDN